MSEKDLDCSVEPNQSNKRLKIDNDCNKENPIEIEKTGDEQVNLNKIRICTHICEKKKRRCKFNAIKNSEFCVEHLAFNNQNELIEKRVICPLDPKHSVYEKNLTKHLKKCNSKEKCLGDFDRKNLNVTDDIGEDESAEIQIENENLRNLPAYKQLSEEQLKHVLEFIDSLDKEHNLHDLPFEKLENSHINAVLETKNDYNKKHLRQISSIASHVNHVLEEESTDNDTSCLVELGAGRGKLSYWFEQAKNSDDSKNKNKKVHIILVERGAQKHKVDTLLRIGMQTRNTICERIRIDLKDLFLNKVPLIENSDKYILYGKHLCGVATDFSLRCLRHSLEDKDQQVLKFNGLLLAVCCHHKCEYDKLCGKDYLRKLKIDSKLFNVIQSISSWCTSGERDVTGPKETIFGFNRQRIGRICKNLIDFARIDYLKNSIKLPQGYLLKTKLIYYIETDVTLENSMIHVTVEKNKD